VEDIEGGSVVELQLIALGGQSLLSILGLGALMKELYERKVQPTGEVRTDDDTHRTAR
jgi:hypothetical protein